jgi:transcriptional regulator with XRE-family HTH domain
MKFDLLGTRLKEAREKKGLSQQGLADSVKTNKQNIAAYEQQRAQPDNKLLAKIADACGVTVDWLLGINKTESDLAQQLHACQSENLMLKQENEKLKAALSPAFVETILGLQQTMKRKEKIRRLS